MEQLNLLKTLPDDIYIITWSYAIKLQDNNFRKPNDLDIIFNQKYSEFIRFTAEKNWRTVKEEWHYELEVIFLEKDWFEIHAIPYNILPTNIIKKDWYNVLKQEEVYWYKTAILKQYKREDEQFKKHLTDIGYMHNKRNDYFTDEERWNKIPELPF